MLFLSSAACASVVLQYPDPVRLSRGAAFVLKPLAAARGFRMFFLYIATKGRLSQSERITVADTTSLATSFALCLQRGDLF